MRVGEKFREHHPDGDRARDADGRPIVEPQPEPQPSFPAPAKGDEPKADKKKGAA